MSAAQRQHLQPVRVAESLPLPAGAAAPFLRRTLVLIPALNEAGCVAETVRAWHQLGAWGVRVVDNGSTDETGQRAAAAGAQVVRETRRGYGAAAWRGLQDWPLNCDWVLFSSADGSDQLSAAAAAAWQRAVDSGADLVLGDRTAWPAARGHLSLAQRLGNWLCCAVIARGWSRRFHDIASLRLVRREALDEMGLRDRGFGWNVEMQVRSLELGLRSIELPVNYFPRRCGRSKISGNVTGTCRAGLAILRMLAYLWQLRSGRRRRLPVG